MKGKIKVLLHITVIAILCGLMWIRVQPVSSSTSIQTQVTQLPALPKDIGHVIGLVNTDRGLQLSYFDTNGKLTLVQYSYSTTTGGDVEYENMFIWKQQ